VVSAPCPDLLLSASTTPPVAPYRVPIRIVWDDRNPIAVIEIGRRLAAMAHAPLTVLEGVGHYPQMEAPAAWAEAIAAAA